MTVSLGTLARVINGRAYKQDELLNSGKYRVLRVGNFFSNGSWYYSDLELEDDKYCESGDLLFAWSASFGPKIWSDEKVIYHYHIWKIVEDPKLINRKFLYYFLMNSVKGMMASTHGSIMLHLTKDFIERLPVHLPNEISTQKSISDVLSSIDEKIDCNNRIKLELDSLAKFLYDYWFVQFEFPDESNKPYKSSGGKMLFNEALKRPIPLGWKDGSLWDIANYFNGLAMQKHRPTGDKFLPVIKIKEMGEGITENTEMASVDIPAAAIIDDGDVLFSWSATLDVKIWSHGKGALNQHIFKVTSKKFPKTFFYFELLAYLAHFKMMAERRKTTMGHITQDHLKQSRICIPPIELLLKAHDLINPLLEKRLIYEKENQQLIKIRDWLLPMLMNGQVTVA
jgi:type I restriction enzyme, S subunit